MQFQEKKRGEKQKNEYFQTQWRKHVDKLTIPPKQTPVYLAVSKGPSKEKKHRTGEDLHSSVKKIIKTTIRKQYIFFNVHFIYCIYFIYFYSYRVG